MQPSSKGPVEENREKPLQEEDAKPDENPTQEEQEEAKPPKSELKVKQADGSGSEDEDEEIRRFRIDSGLLPFPEKLMALLDGNQVSDAMWWLPDGDAFCLIPSIFAEKVLDQHFSGTKFESFTRKVSEQRTCRSNAESRFARWLVFFFGLA